MPLIRDFVEERYLKEDETPLFLRDPKLRQIIVVDESFEPQRILASSLQEISLFSWEGQDEDAVLVRALRSAATGVKSLVVPQMTPSVWTKLRGYMHGIVLHPSLNLTGMPEMTVVFQSFEVPLGQLLCLGPKMGTLMIKDDLQGYVLPEQEGPLCVTVRAFVGA